MPVSQLLALAQAGQYDAFEARCLELLESDQLTLAQLAAPFQAFEQHGEAERLATLTLMIIENVGVDAEPAAALALVRTALTASPKHEELRRLTAELYRRVHGQTEGFDALLAASGLREGRPIRSALKLLDLSLALRPGDTLISRMDDRVVEVSEVDHGRGLFTLRREGRTTVVPAVEAARDYDRIAGDDFRVLRQLRPERLAQLIQEDAVAVVVGLIHAHGEHIDADVLKHELVPKYIASKDWSRWWTKARAELKRSPHVLVEGRSPIILSYSAEAKTLEDEAWDVLASQNDPVDWLHTVEGYLREKAARKEQPDQPLLWRIHDHILNYAGDVRARRPAEALACGLVLARLAEKGLPSVDESRDLPVTILREAADPGLLLRGVEHENLRERGLDALQAARPEAWLRIALGWLPTAPAGLLDKLAAGVIQAGDAAAVQAFIDQGLADLARHPELIYWLWKGPKRRDALRLPRDEDLFRMIVDALSALGRTISADADIVREFRHRMKAALSLRDYERVRQCLAGCSEAAAITIRSQLLRLEGLGENAPARLLDILRDVHPRLWVVRPQDVAPWDDPETIWCTIDGLRRRTAERDEILNKKMPENAKRIGEAASHGDLSENSEYKFALEERDLLRARLAKINDELSRARTLAPHDVPSEHVGVGSRVTLRNMADGNERVMTFLGPFETDVDAGVFNYSAPLSQRLMGRPVGDHVTLNIDGHEVEFEVAAISCAVARFEG